MSSAKNQRRDKSAYQSSSLTEPESATPKKKASSSARKPGWDDTRHDLTKFKLSSDEVEKRRKERLLSKHKPNMRPVFHHVERPASVSGDHRSQRGLNESQDSFDHPSAYASVARELQSERDQGRAHAPRQQGNGTTVSSRAPSEGGKSSVEDFEPRQAAGSQTASAAPSCDSPLSQHAHDDVCSPLAHPPSSGQPSRLQAVTTVSHAPGSPSSPSAAAASRSPSATGTGTSRSPSPPPVDPKVASLEAQVASLQQQTHTLQAQLHAQERQFKEHTDHLTSTITTLQAQLQALLTSPRLPLPPTSAPTPIPTPASAPEFPTNVTAPTGPLAFSPPRAWIPEDTPPGSPMHPYASSTLADEAALPAYGDRAKILQPLPSATATTTSITADDNPRVLADTTRSTSSPQRRPAPSPPPYSSSSADPQAHYALYSDGASGPPPGPGASHATPPAMRPSLARPSIAAAGSMHQAFIAQHVAREDTLTPLTARSASILGRTPGWSFGNYNPLSAYGPPVSASRGTAPAAAVSAAAALAAAPDPSDAAPMRPASGTNNSLSLKAFVA